MPIINYSDYELDTSKKRNKYAILNAKIEELQNDIQTLLQENKRLTLETLRLTKLLIGKNHNSQ